MIDTMSMMVTEREKSILYKATPGHCEPDTSGAWNVKKTTRPIYILLSLLITRFFHYSGLTAVAKAATMAIPLLRLAVVGYDCW